MILFLDTTDNPTIIRLYSAAGEVIDESIWESHFNQSEELLSRINDLISRTKRDKSNLRAIIVICGPGSFTGVRIGVTTANFLSFGLDIPVIGLKKTININPAALVKNISSKSFSKPVLPYYDKKPNITKPRKN